MKRKLLALLLTVATSLTLIFTGCGSKEDSIVGKWEGKADMTDAMNEMMSAMMGEDFTIDEFAFDVEMEFTKDEMTISIPDGAFDDCAEILADEMTEFAKNLLETEAASAGVTTDELLESVGMTEEEYYASMDVDTIIESFEDEVGDMEETGSYELKDGEIVDEDGESVKYELDGDNLTIYFEDDDLEMTFELERK